MTQVFNIFVIIWFIFALHKMMDKWNEWTRLLIHLRQTQINLIHWIGIHTHTYTLWEGRGDSLMMNHYNFRRENYKSLFSQFRKITSIFLFQQNEVKINEFLKGFYYYLLIWNKLFHSNDNIYKYQTFLLKNINESTNTFD